jgi:hypothetical protein
MLKNLSAEIRECYEHADLELRWLLLARNDELAKRLVDFSSEAARRGTTGEELTTPTMTASRLPSW